MTDALRLACVDFAPTEADIIGLLLACESDREAGTTKRQAIEAWMFTCAGFDWDPDLPADCATCGLAVIEQIYD